MSYHELLPAQKLHYSESLAKILTPKESRALLDVLTDIRLLEAVTFREQCFLLTTILHDTETEEDKTIVSYDKIGMLFDPPKNHGSIIQQAQKYQRIIKAPHRPYLLSPQEVNQIKEALLQTDDYPSIEDISIYIAMMFNKYPSRSTIKRAIKERIEGFKIVEVKPIEEDRYDVTLKEIEDYYNELKVEAIGVPVGFIFNLDESGQNQYVDAPYMYIVVPEDKEISTYPLNRATKRITLLHCISTDGSSCDPMIIVPRFTLDDEIFDEITTQSVLFRSQIKGFCTHELFTDWMINKFLPYLTYQRKKYNYTGKAIIIMDGFKGHEKSLETLENVLHEFNLKIILIPPHSSDQVQPLDLFGFNIQKNRTQKFIVEKHYTWQTNQILAILEGLNTIRSPHAIRIAWEMSGIFRERNTEQESPETTFIQYHIIDMKANTHIRALQEREDRLIGTLNRRRKYKVLDPTDRFKKRKELKLKRPEDVYIPKVSREEAADIKTKLKQDVFVPITNNNDCHQITEYFKVTPKNMKKKKKASKTRDTANADSQTKKRRHRVAKLVLPSHSDF